MSERLLFDNSLTSTLMLLIRFHIVSRYREQAQTMPHIINTTAVAMSSMNKKPRNLKLPSMQRSDLVLKECVQLVI